MSSSWSYLDPVILPLIVGESVLDAGCGMGRWGVLIETNYWEAHLKSPPIVDGCDAFEANVERCRRLGAYRDVWVRTLPSPLHSTWDTILASELIEHVPQNQVVQTLDLLEAAATERVIISTPNSPLYRPGSDAGLGFNEYEAHVSYVSRGLLRERGYHLYGVGFGRYNSRLARRAAKWHLRRSLASIPYRVPAIGETLVAVKDVR
jgi:SAM-dependent methyltransferase